MTIERQSSWRGEGELRDALRPRLLELMRRASIRPADAEAELSTFRLLRQRRAE